MSLEKFILKLKLLLFMKESIDIVSIEIFVKIFRCCIALKFYYIECFLNI